MDLSSLNRLVFGHLVKVEILMKCPPVSSPPHTVRLSSDAEIPFHSEKNLFHKVRDTRNVIIYSSTSIGARGLSE